MIAAAGLLLQLVASASAQGTVVPETFWSQSLGTSKQVVVYLPPSYARSSARRYPVAYYLHGLGGNERDWTARAGLDAICDTFVPGEGGLP